MRLAVAVRLALVLYAAVEVALFVLVGQWLGGGRCSSGYWRPRRSVSC